MAMLDREGRAVDTEVPRRRYILDGYMGNSRVVMRR